MSTQIYYLFYLYGIGSLLPWNAILTALDYFESRLGNHHPSFLFPILMYTPCLLFSFVNIIIVKYISAETRIVFSFLSVMTTTLSIPLITEYLDEAEAWRIIVILITFLGISHSFLNAGIYGFANAFPSKYISALAVGQGISGLVCSIIRVIFLLSMPFDNKLELKSVESDGYYKNERFNIYFLCNISYFILSVFIILLCLASFLFTRNNIFVRQCLIKSEIKQNHTERDTLVENLVFIQDDILEAQKVERGAFSEYSDIYLNVGSQLFQLTLCYIITFIVFPGVSLNTSLSLIDSFYSSRAWFTVIMVTVFGIFDTLGRSCNSFILSQSQTLLLTLSRLIFIPSFIMIQNSNNIDSIFNTDTYKFLNMILFSLSNGLVTIQLLTQINLFSKSIYGVLSNFHIQFGIFIGSLISLALIKTN